MNHFAYDAFGVFYCGSWTVWGQPDNDRKEVTMRIFALASALLGLAAAVPAAAQTTQRPDTGNMAYPTPVPQGNLSTTTVGRQAPDTGNMAYPTPVPQGNIGTTVVGPQPPQTGNMAYPAPLPQGNVGTTTVK